MAGQDSIYASSHSLMSFTLLAGKMPKSVLVTGCSRGGIGHALAREFLSKGTHTALPVLAHTRGLKWHSR